MRIVLLGLVLSLVLGCADTAQKDVESSGADEGDGVAMTETHRKATEDSVKAWLKLMENLFVKEDSAAIVSSYTTDGPLISAGDGQLMTSRDSVSAMLSSAFSQVKDAKATYEDPKISVLAPGVAAVTATNRLEGMNQGKKFASRGVYSAVLAVRDGRMRVIQEHNSTGRP